jgi:vitamin B12 transporter
MVVDFSAAYTYAQKHTLSLFANNITDENYYEKRGYNLAGRNFALRYGFTF